MLQRKSTGEYLESGTTFASTMVAGLLHEIVHYYANAAVPPTKSPEDDKKVYYVNECVGLKGRKARLMPNCYVYYVLSKLESDFFLLRLRISTVPSFCTSFVSSPDPLHFAEYIGYFGGLKGVSSLNSSLQASIKNAKSSRICRQEWNC